MTRGIHRINDKNGRRRAFISEAPDQAGEWLTEVEYRTRGYLPVFESLPVVVKVVQRIGPPVSVSIDDLPEVDREFVRQLLKERDAEES